MNQILIEIEGQESTTKTLSNEDFLNFEESYQVADVSTLDERKKGRAVSFDAIVNHLKLNEDMGYLTLHASKDDFHASIPLDQIKERAYMIYELDGEALPLGKGGPFRFFITDAVACQTGDVDNCANVKFVDRISFSKIKGQDNRPQGDSAHKG